MLEKIRRNIEKNELLRKENLQLVALSGGADSVALLRILLLLGYKVEAMHCNFHLRGDESNRDEEFCKSLCEGLSVPLHLIHFDTREYAALHHVSIEMAARDLRYGYFHQLRKDLDAEAIVVAHHMDDQAETVLMNIIRGTGLKGLCGMLPKNNSIVRPLLCITRKDIETFLKDIGQTYITDSSNLVDDVTRNKLRLNIIPLLKEINPKATENISSMAEHVLESLPYTADGIIASVEKEPLCSSLNISEIKDSLRYQQDAHSLDFLLYNILYDKGLTKEQIQDIAEKVSDGKEDISSLTGKMWQSKTHTVIIDRGRILIEVNTEEQPKEWMFPEEGYYALDGGRHIRLTVVEKDADFSIDRSKDVAMLDAAKVKWPLRLRTVSKGDRFVPYGMKGSRLVSDFLTDKKVSLLSRKHQRILTDASLTPLWLAGWRTDDRYKITDDTIKVLIVRYC